jgi:hypothetical protein
MTSVSEMQQQSRVPKEPVTDEELKSFIATFKWWLRFRGVMNPRLNTLVVFLEINAPGYVPYSGRIWDML